MGLKVNKSCKFLLVPTIHLGSLIGFGEAFGIFLGCFGELVWNVLGIFWDDLWEVSGVSLGHIWDFLKIFF